MYNNQETGRRKRAVMVVGPEELDVTAKIGLLLDGQRIGVTKSTAEEAFDLKVKEHIWNTIEVLAGAASNREVKLLLTVSFLNDALGIEL